MLFAEHLQETHIKLDMSGAEIWRSLNTSFFTEGLVRLLNTFSKLFINCFSVTQRFLLSLPQLPSQQRSAPAGPSASLADPKQRAIPVQSHRVTQCYFTPSSSSSFSPARGEEGEQHRAKGPPHRTNGPQAAAGTAWRGAPQPGTRW